MEKKKNYYTGAGLALGTGIGGGIAMLLYVFTNQPVFIAFAGLGTALGLAWGTTMDKKHLE